MAFNLNEIRSQLVHGGWKPSHFQVIITNPFDTTSDIKTPFMVRAASLPTYTIGKIPVPYFGRQIFVPGDRTFEEWTTTIINDEDFVIRNSLEIWHNNINSLEGNLASTAEVGNMKATGVITAFGKNGRTIRQYQLNGLFPMTIQGIDTDWGTTDTIAEYQVTWSFDDAEVIGGDSGDGGGK